MTEPLTGEWTTLRGGGAIVHTDLELGLALAPRVLIEVAARVGDAGRFAANGGATDPDQTATWITAKLVQLCEAYLLQRSVTKAMAGKYPIAEDLTPIANGELGQMGVEVNVVSVRVSVSEEDHEAIAAAAMAAARAAMAKRQ